MVYLDPETGDLLNTVSYSTYGNPVQIQFDENGKAIVGVFGSSVPGYVVRDTQVIATTAAPLLLRLFCGRPPRRSRVRRTGLGHGSGMDPERRH